MPLLPEYALDIAATLQGTDHDGALWGVASEQLNANLLRLSTGAQIAAHINSEVDVLLVVFAGRGTLTVDGAEQPLAAGQIALVPRGAERGIYCVDGPLVYLTCHRRRAGLMPV